MSVLSGIDFVQYVNFAIAFSFFFFCSYYYATYKCVFWDFSWVTSSSARFIYTVCCLANRLVVECFTGGKGYKNKIAKVVIKRRTQINKPQITACASNVSLYLFIYLIHFTLFTIYCLHECYEINKNMSCWVDSKTLVNTKKLIILTVDSTKYIWHSPYIFCTDYSLPLQFLYFLTVTHSGYQFLETLIVYDTVCITMQR